MIISKPISDPTRVRVFLHIWKSWAFYQPAMGPIPFNRGEKPLAINYLNNL